MKAAIMLSTALLQGQHFDAGYIIGAVVSLFLLGYLLYSLIRPEKF
jgi:K+-transporting ATPase KdpF subunit